jgi:tetratricopeptide (TPR) repeat protein
VLEGRLHVFDPALGLPIPGPDGRTPATLAELRGDDSLLRRLDLSAEQTYPVAAADLATVDVGVVASPFSLSKRAAAVDARLGASRKLELLAFPSESVAGLTDRTGLGRVGLWTAPLERLRDRERMTREQLRQYDDRAAVYYAQELDSSVPIELRLPIEQRPSLWMARFLHLAGNLEGFAGERKLGALQTYLASRVSDEELQQFRSLLATGLAGDSSDERRIRFFEAMTAVVARAEVEKQHASYWLAVANYDQGRHAPAIDYFEKRVLLAFPGGIWTDGAEYGLARCYEASGRTADAIARLRRTIASPQHYGNLLRARDLERQSGASNPPPPGPDPSPAPVDPAPPSPPAASPSATNPAP